MARKAPIESTSESAPAVEFIGARDAEGRPTVFYSSIPARDLTARDVARLTPDQQAVVRSSTIYRVNDESLFKTVEPIRQEVELTPPENVELTPSEQPGKQDGED